MQAATPRIHADLTYIRQMLAAPAPVSDRDYAWSYGLMRGAIQFIEAELEQLARDLVDDDAQDAQETAARAAWEAAVDAYEPDADDYERMAEWDAEEAALAS